MKAKKVLAALTIAVGLMTAASTLASADEELASSNQKLILQGQQVIRLNDQLNLDRVRAARINSVIVVASTRAGMGQLSVWYQGAHVAQQRVGTELQSIQIPVRMDMRGRDFRGLEIRTQGNFTIAMVGVTYEVGGWDDPRYRPGYPGRGDGRDHGGAGGGYYGNYLSQAEYDGLIRQMNSASFDDQRISILTQYLGYLGQRQIVMEQASGILRLFSFDDGRMNALRSLKAGLVVDVTKLDLVLNTFSFQSNRDAARQLLLQR